MEQNNRFLLTRRNTLLLALMVAYLGINAATWFFFVAPAYKEHDSLKDEIAQAEGQLNQLRNEYVTDSISEEMLEELAGQIPDTFEDSAALEQVLTVGLKSKVLTAHFAQSSTSSAEDQTAGTEAQQASSTSLAYDLVLVGHLDNLVSYVDNMQQFERLFTVKSWSFNELTKDVIERDYPDIYGHAFTDKNKEILSLHLTVETYAKNTTAQ
ncbi:hypothetical protein [Paenibacillus soyae]|uniref:Uncharacterized protein n=1 Tax=Paenibacillus soyae TaxID=2969249 RepID=A0A9X2MUI5_9BACL|nr:hypothetical protein [Paenibacillus soyae]MCR2806519.1 hypothetical protein [Paenibacillus soyae]